MKTIHDLFKEEISPKALPSLPCKTKSNLIQFCVRKAPDRVRQIQLELCKENQNASSTEEPVALPREAEAVESRIN